MTSHDIVLIHGKKLQAMGIESPWREVRLLLAHVLGETYEAILLNPERTLSSQQGEHLEGLVRRRLNHEPISKIIGRREFWGLDFLVTHDTLDPRPDSETIVESVLKIFPIKENPLKILDLGVGTGCLLISLLREYPQGFGVGVDRSEAALHVAIKNADTLGVSNRCDFMRGNWADAVKDKFDIIVSNPPYIAHNEILPPEVSLFDPPEALFAGENGLSCYFELAQNLKRVLKSTGKIFVEVGIGQSKSVPKIFKNKGFSLIQEQLDIRGICRTFTFCIEDMKKNDCKG